MCTLLFAMSSSEPLPSASVAADPDKLSALRANIEKNGKLSYYFAHAEKKEAHISFHGPPKLISSEGEAGAATPAAPKARRVRIEKYGWCDGTKAVSVFVDFEGLEALPEDAVQVTSGPQSFELTITKAAAGTAAAAEVHVLKLGPLSEEITGVTVKRKPASLVLRLAKKDTTTTWFELLKGGGGAGVDD